MTSTSAAPELGGAGSVLVIWSLIVVVIGAALFAYSIVVTLRGNRQRRRRRRVPASPPHRPAPRASAPRPLALPSGPTVGGMPVNRSAGMGRPRALPAGPLPAGPSSRPLALPGGSGPRYPSAPPPAALPSAGLGAALPTGPVAGSGYGVPAPSTYGYAGSAQAVRPAIAEVPAISATPALYGTPSMPSTPAMPSMPTVSTVYGAPPAISPPAPARPDQGYQDHGKPHRESRRSRPDECATLRAECEQLKEIAAAAAAAAAQAALDAEATQADFVAAHSTADAARRACDALAQEAAEIAAQLGALERTATDDQERLQDETSHAAFGAYRRGDISSEQLREVFRRAEGWTPEHDRLSHRSTELRGEEAEATRARDVAVLAEHNAGERARVGAISARALDDEARTAAVDARGRCAAADACEQRNRRRQ